MPIERDILHFFIDEVATQGLPQGLGKGIDPSMGNVYLVEGERTLVIVLNSNPIGKEVAANAFVSICQVFFDPKFASKYPMDLIPDGGNEDRNNPWGDSAWEDEGFRYHPEIPWAGLDKIAVLIKLEGNVDPSFGTAPSVSVLALETIENFRRVDQSAFEIQAFFQRCLKQGQGFKDLLMSW